MIFGGTNTCQVCGKSGKWPIVPFLNNQAAAARPLNCAALVAEAEMTIYQAGDFLLYPAHHYSSLLKAGHLFFFFCPDCMRIGKELAGNGYSRIAKSVEEEGFPRIEITCQEGINVLGTAKVREGLRLKHPKDRKIIAVRKNYFVVSDRYYRELPSVEFGSACVTMSELKHWDHNCDLKVHDYSICYRSSKNPDERSLLTFRDNEAGMQDLITYVLGRDMTDMTIRKKGKLFPLLVTDVVKLRERLADFDDRWSPTESALDFRPCRKSNFFDGAGANL